VSSCTRYDENLVDLVDQIHRTSLRILSELGVRVDHPEMRARLEGAGCRLSEARVFIPEDAVQTTIDHIPSGFHLYGREGRPARIDATGQTLFTNTGILPNIIDFETGLVRRSVRTDVEQTTRLLDAMNEVDIVYVSLVASTDVPAHMATVMDFVSTLENTTKPLIGPGLNDAEESKAVVEMALALRDGDRDALADKPPCAPFVTAITPLTFPAGTVDALQTIALAGLPLVALTNPVMGTTAPYTIASSVALGHAEELAIAVMAHAVRPKLPIVSINTPSVADMHTMTSTTGGPETGLMRGLAVRVARHLGIPSWAHGHTSSPRLDEQASDEKSINCMLIAHALPSLLGGLGGLANVTLTSHEAIVIDNERLGAIRRVLGGIDADDDHLAFDVIADVVHGQSVIVHNHTIKHLRGQEVWNPALARRQGLVNGAPEPGTLREGARETARHLLESHRISPLPRGVKSMIDEIAKAYDISVGMP